MAVTKPDDGFGEVPTWKARELSARRSLGALARGRVNARVLPL
jgi:hypothetical protein